MVDVAPRTAGVEFRRDEDSTARGRGPVDDSEDETTPSSVALLGRCPRSVANLPTQNEY